METLRTGTDWTGIQVLDTTLPRVCLRQVPRSPGFLLHSNRNTYLLVFLLGLNEILQVNA